MVVRMVGKEGTRVMRVTGVVAILFLTSVLAQEPTAERRIAQGPGRNGKAVFLTMCENILLVDFSARSPD